MGTYAVISGDGGKTWTREYALSEPIDNNDLGYPATAELPDGSLVTVYYQDLVDPTTGKPEKDPYAHSWTKPRICSTHWKL